MNSRYNCWCSLIADNQFDEGWVDHWEHGKEHNRAEIMASQLLFSHQLTLQMLPSFTYNQSEQ